MTGFDILLVAIIAGSALFALVRGIVREVIGLAAWIVGIVCGIVFGGSVGAWLPERVFGTQAHLRFVIAFVLILLAVLIVGGVLSTLLKSGLRVIGLGPTDRVLGGVFGVLRGVLIAMIMVLVIASAMPVQDPWWRDSLLAPHLIEGSKIARSALPSDWRAHVDNILPAADASRKPPMPPPAAGARRKV
jgi:membrane protein required for colicin V production